MRTRQSSYKIVGDCSDKGGHRYQLLGRFILRVILARRRVMLMLCVVTYVVSCKLLWNCNGDVILSCISQRLFWQRVCYLTLAWLFFFTKCVVVITEYLRSTPFHFNINELVTQTRHWNQMPHRPKQIWKTMRRRQDFFVKRMRRRQNWYKKMCISDFFWLNLNGYSVLLM